MRPLVLIGLILIVLGIVALAVPSFSFFTADRVADVGFFRIDFSRPHTILLSAIVGGEALVAGIMLHRMGRRSTPSRQARLQTGSEVDLAPVHRKEIWERSNAEAGAPGAPSTFHGMTLWSIGITKGRKT